MSETTSNNDTNYANGYAIGFTEGTERSLSAEYDIIISAHFHDIGTLTFNSQQEYTEYVTEHSSKNYSTVQTDCFSEKKVLHHDAITGTCNISISYYGDYDKAGCDVCRNSNHQTTTVLVEKHSACGRGNGYPHVCSDCRSSYKGSSHTYTIKAAYDEITYAPSCGYADGEILGIELVKR